MPWRFLVLTLSVAQMALAEPPPGEDPSADGVRGGSPAAGGSGGPAAPESREAAAAEEEVPVDEAQGPEGPAGEGRSTSAGSEAAEPARRLEVPSRVDGVRPNRTAVLILAARGVERSTADALTEVVIGAVAARGGVEIMGKEEFQAQLGQGEARSMECVTSIACLGQVGVELDVHEVIAGTIGRRRDAWVFNLNRIDIRSGEMVGRAFREVTGDLGAAAQALQDAVPTLFEVEQRPGRLIVSANVKGAEVSLDGVLVGIYRGDPVRIDTVIPGRHELSVSAPGHGDWDRAINVGDGSIMQVDASLEEFEVSRGLSPALFVGAGAAALAFGTAVTFGVRSQKSLARDATRAEALTFVRKRRRDARTANAALAVGAAGVGTVVFGLFLSDFGDGTDSRPRVDVVARRTGALLQIGGAL